MHFLEIPGRRFVNIAADVELGKDVVIYEFTNLYGCRIGSLTQIGTFVEIQRGVTVGKSCRIQSHTFICDGVTIGDEVFIGHGVLFINDRHPTVKDTLAGTWIKEPIAVGDRATIGSGAIIMAGVKIGEEAVIGAGAVVTRDVPSHSTVAGVPARLLARRHQEGAES
jgi:acetyltransferase-like isoleucine patch superfamily enzyme